MELELTWMAFIMLILASYRLTHLIVFDKITEFIRKPFLTKRRSHKRNKDGTQIQNRLPSDLLLVCRNLERDISRYDIFVDSRYRPVYNPCPGNCGGQAILESFVGVNIKRTALYDEEAKELK